MAGQRQSRTRPAVSFDETPAQQASRGFCDDFAKWSLTPGRALAYTTDIETAAAPGQPDGLAVNRTWQEVVGSVRIGASTARKYF
jgi:hypothetical protein